MTSYGLGIDLGTTSTAAAIHVDGRVEVARLGSRRLEAPTLVFLDDNGTMLVGEVAERRGSGDPRGLASEFKRRVGDPVSLLVRGAPYSAHALMANVLRQVLQHVSQHQQGSPTDVVVTHPANWGPYKLELLTQAVRLADLEHASFCSEPQAAAIQYSSGERLQPGEVVAVYDLGGGTFDAAILRKTSDGFELLGTPEGIEQLGGSDFDDAVFGHVMGALGDAATALDPEDPATTAGLYRLRRDCIESKEALSFDTQVTIPVSLPGLHSQIRLNRSELEDMIGPALGETVGAMRRAIRAAGVAPADVRVILLAGGSSRIPLVATMLSEAFDRPVVLDPHPEHSVAMGAAWLSSTHSHAPVDRPGPPAPSDPPSSVRHEAAPPATVDRSPRQLTPPAQGRPGPRRLLPGSRAGRATVAAVALAAVVGGTAYGLTRQHDGSATASGGGSAATANSTLQTRPTEVWSLDTGRPITGRPAVSGGLVYFGSQNGTVYAVDRASHAIAWQHATGAKVVSSPTVVDGVVYTASQDGFVYALGAADGKLRWRTRAGVEITSSPSVAGGSLYIGSNDNAVYALDLGGKVRWRFVTGGQVWGTPAVGNGLVYAASKDGNLYALDTERGRVRWQTRVGADFSSPSVVDEMVYIGSSGKQVMALDARSGKVRWTFPTFHWVSSSVLVRGGTVYAADFSGIVFALDARTGGERWRCTIPGDKPIFSSPTLSDGVLYVGSHDNRLHALRADTGVQLWDFLTDGIVGASPVVADGFVYVGSDDGRMYGIRLPARSGG